MASVSRLSSMSNVFVFVLFISAHQMHCLTLCYGFEPEAVHKCVADGLALLLDSGGKTKKRYSGQQKFEDARCGKRCGGASRLQKSVFMPCVGPLGPDSALS